MARIWGTSCHPNSFCMSEVQVSNLSSQTLEELSNAVEKEVIDSDGHKDGVVSFHSELPLALQVAMASFIERYPNWDQYRLVQAALAGFLVQNGVESRPITRLYVGNMFSSESLTQGV